MTDQEEAEKREHDDGMVALRAGRSTVNPGSRAEEVMGESGPGPPGTDTEPRHH